MASPTPEAMLQKGLARRPTHIHSTKLLTNRETLPQIYATRSISIPLSTSTGYITWFYTSKAPNPSQRGHTIQQTAYLPWRYTNKK
jgi:hypothetical protein